MTTSDLMKALADAGAPFDAILIAVKALEEKDAELAKRDAEKAEKRERDAERKRVARGGLKRPRNVRGQSSDSPRTPPNDIYSNPPATSDEVADARAPAGKRDKFPCPEGVDPLDWSALKENRKTKRAALTEGAHRQIVRKLEVWSRAGWPPGPIVAFAAERGWTTVFETDAMKSPALGHSPPAAPKSFAMQVIEQAEQRKAMAAQ